MLTLDKIKYRHGENKRFRSVFYRQMTYIAVGRCRRRGLWVVCWDLRQSYVAGFLGTGLWCRIFLYLDRITTGGSWGGYSNRPAFHLRSLETLRILGSFAH